MENSKRKFKKVIKLSTTTKSLLVVQSRAEELSFFAFFRFLPRTFNETKAEMF